MKRILLLSHGSFAQGAKDAATMLLGESDVLDCLGLYGDIEAFRAELRERLNVLKDSEQIIVMADLRVGSPYSSALTMLDEMGLMQKSVVISGFNLALVFSWR